MPGTAGAVAGGSPCRSRSPPAPITEDVLLRPKRFEDQGRDLWATLNVVQEHLTKGGDQGRAATGRRLTTRGIKAISEDQRVNRALWAYAEAVAERKAA